MTSGTARRALAAAITTVLAATALAAAPGATAATGTAPAARAQAVTEAQAVPKLPPKTEVISAGPSGYLGSTEDYDSEGMYSYEYRWYRPDGTSTLLSKASSAGPALPNALVSDIAVTADTYDYRVIRLHDMSAPAGTAPVVIDLRTLGPTHTFVGAYGSTLLVTVGAPNGPRELHLVSKSGTKLSDVKVTGVPADTGRVIEAKGTPGTALVTHNPVGSAWNKTALVVIDLASGAVTRADAPLTGDQPVAASAERLVRWQGPDLVVTDRATGKDVTTSVGGHGGLLGLFGDWVAYGRATATGGGTAGDPLLPLTARSLADGRTVTLLDRASSVVNGPDGTLLVRGGTVGKGEGVYRIAPGPDGVPAAELVASTGESTALTLTGTSVGPVVDLDLMNNRARLSWQLSHDDFEYTVELIHQQSRQRYRYTFEDQSSSRFDFLWRGNFADGEGEPGRAAFNGDYTWELTAKPHNGIGPDLHATGDFKAVRTPKLHDFNDNGSPDLLFRDKSGSLRRVDTVYDAWKSKVVPPGDPEYVGEGWQGHRQIESVGDVAGTTAPDVVGVDASGVLWLHPGTGDERNPLGARVKVGGGWQVYDRLAGGSDLTGDGRADLVATDKAGDLYLYKGTGNTAAPFAPRKKIGFGWGIYNQLTAVGNIAGAAAGDLVARDKDGVLWLYLGKGDGTYAPRVKIGAGWNQYTHLVGIGDATMDGRADLYAFGPDNTSYVYAGTGGWKTPFQPRVPTDVLVTGTTGADVTHVS
ncbi:MULTISPECIES: FG-GAP repeat domain-containing protein [unclassified Streptomyces]|uniref:FG-GAP repeat domain-containing protein n=1 Tax=unclassified Streptomyces TaxID=2593676 RepID=UPI00131EA0EA|nr:MULTISPECIES: VCBS repeat-containing protein [unclassified Streptomyces]